MSFIRFIVVCLILPHHVLLPVRQGNPACCYRSHCFLICNFHTHILCFSSDRLIQLMTVGNPMRSQPEAPTEVVAGISDGSDSPASTVATASLGMYVLCLFVCMHVHVCVCGIDVFLFVCAVVCSVSVCVHVCVHEKLKIEEAAAHSPGYWC